MEALCRHEKQRILSDRQTKTFRNGMNVSDAIDTMDKAEILEEIQYRRSL